MLTELLPLISAAIFVGSTLACAQIIEAQEDSDMANDSHFREELGVNQYTTPSIEQLFNTLDSLKPIPIQELTRPPRALRLDNRVKFALSFGVLIGDGFLAVEGEQVKAIETACIDVIPMKKIVSETTYHTELSRWPVDHVVPFWLGLGLVFIGLVLSPVARWIGQGG